MKIAIANLESISPYSQSRQHHIPRDDKEDWDAYEKRTWIDHCHFNAAGNAFIPPMCFKRAIESAAKMLRMRIAGKGSSEYGKHFLAGILVTEGLVLPFRREDVVGEWLDMNADGRRGSSKRVLRCYPIFPQWKGDARYYVLDDTITETVFEKHLRESGNFVGIGRFRPEVGGFYGRFKVNGIVWEVE